MKQRSGFIARHTQVRKVSAKRLAAERRAKWSSITAPRKAVKARNAKRKAREFVRAFGGLDRVLFVKSRPCIVANGDCFGEIENAHIKGDGVGRRADADQTVPCCTGHHTLRYDSMHATGARAFEQRFGINLASLAALTEREYQTYAARTA